MRQAARPVRSRSAPPRPVSRSEYRPAPGSESGPKQGLEQGLKRASPPAPAVMTGQGREPAEGPSPASQTRPRASKMPPVPFSPEWEALWHQMAVGSPRPLAVWTYPELGTDLRGDASADRRRVLQELIAALKMPRGSHAFWPYALPPENTPAVDMFLSGLARFRPASVLLMGDRAASDLAPIGPLPAGALQNCLCRGCRFVRLPDMSVIAGSSASVRARLIEFIRTSLV